MNIRQALALARQLGVARLDAQLLLAHALRRERTWLVAHDDHELAVGDQQWFEQALARRRDDVPLAYLTGEREFHGMRLLVTPAVLVPRPETEILVDWALTLLPAPAAGVAAPRVADLGTGSGAIALAVRRSAPWAEVTAVDLSEAALEVARENARRLDLDVEFVSGSWWAPLPARDFELVVSNPPYVAGADAHLQALRHEPLAALTPGGDGLAAIQSVIDGACGHLVAGGWLLLEHGHDQSEAVQQRLAAAGFVKCETRCDLAGLPRCTGGRWPGPGDGAQPRSGSSGAATAVTR